MSKSSHYTPEQKATLALSLVDGVGSTLSHTLLDECGSAHDIWSMGRDKLLQIPGVGDKLVEAIFSGDALLKAEEEIEILSTRPHMRAYFSCDNNFPEALKFCIDSPLVLYAYGTLPEEHNPWISIVGSRQCTHYGEMVVEYIIREIAKKAPKAVIVSGLAYGIDIQAHRMALKYGLKTVAVLAHGLHTLYPSVHRQDAEEIIRQGGAIITEYPFETKPLPPRFVARNRIVAGLSSSTIVIESAKKGGSLTTADMAFSYSRSVFAVPGRLNDKHSEGCNGLIASHKASIFTDVKEFLNEIGYIKQEVKQPTLGLLLDIPERLSSSPYFETIREKGPIAVEDIALIHGDPVYVVSSELFELEIEEYVRSMPGGKYELDFRYK